MVSSGYTILTKFLTPVELRDTFNQDLCTEKKKPKTSELLFEFGIL